MKTKKEVITDWDSKKRDFKRITIPYEDPSRPKLDGKDIFMLVAILIMFLGVVWALMQVLPVILDHIDEFLGAIRWDE